MDRLQTLNKGFENKIIELQQKLTDQVGTCTCIYTLIVQARGWATAPAIP